MPWPTNSAKFGVICSRREPVEKRLDRQRRRAIRPFDDRRHALPHVVVRGRHLEDAAPRMGMDVDEARRDDFAAGVDRPRRRRIDPRRDARNRVAAHRQVAAIPRAAGAVDDPAVANDQIVGGGRLRLCAGHDADQQRGAAGEKSVSRMRAECSAEDGQLRIWNKN